MTREVEAFEYRRRVYELLDVYARPYDAREPVICLDGQPFSSTTFINMVAKVARLPLPPQVSMEEAQLTFSPERLSFLNESRRVSNERMLKHLGVVLRYADVEAGIRARLPVIPA